MFIQHAAFVLHAESAALSVGSSLLARTSSAAARISESASRACWREGADTLKGGHRTAARISESASRACQAPFGVHPLGCLSSLEGREALTGVFSIRVQSSVLRPRFQSLLTSTATTPLGAIIAAVRLAPPSVPCAPGSLWNWRSATLQRHTSRVCPPRFPLVAGLPVQRASQGFQKP
jgi:hypothetical protein